MGETLKHIKLKLCEKQIHEEISQNVKVVVRIRPLSQKEIDNDSEIITEVDEQCRSITVRNKHFRHRDEPKSFGFDRVFPDTVGQSQFYQETAKDIVESVIKGYNGTIFAYGQTGAGKTYTMEGYHDVPEENGVIPNSFAHIFECISTATKEETFLVRVSYMEIYNEEIHDLLSKEHLTKKLHLKENEKGLFVEDLTSIIVEKAEDMNEIMDLGKRNRTVRTGSVASTNMNSSSSRSHAIFTISIERSYRHKNGGAIIRMGKLNLVDLAGSERLSKTAASGDRLRESTKINLSLSNLGIVISALIDGNPYIPYRNSKLTRLLSDSLGGNSMTIMCANVGPADYNYDETVSTLRYASRAKAIKNTARINEDPKDALLKEFQYELDLLRQLLAHDDANPLSREELQEAAEMFPYFGELAHNGEELKLNSQEFANNFPSEAEAEGSGDHKVSKNETDGASDEEESEEGDEDEDPEENSEMEAGDGVLVGKGKSHHQEEAYKNIKGLIESQKEIVTRLGTAKKDKKKVMTALQENMETYQKQQEEKKLLLGKIKTIQRKILVGGVNLLDKSEEQEVMLLKSDEALQKKKKEQEELKNRIQSKTEENQRLESELKETQERNQHVTKRIKKLWDTYRTLVADMEGFRAEHEREKVSLEEQKKQNTQELKKMSFIINNYMSEECLQIIKSNCSWSEEIDDYKLNCASFAGNFIQRRKEWNPLDIVKETPPVVDLSYVYKSIDDGLPVQGPQQANAAGVKSPPPPGQKYTKILLGGDM